MGRVIYIVMKSGIYRTPFPLVAYSNKTEANAHVQRLGIDEEGIPKGSIQELILISNNED